MINALKTYSRVHFHNKNSDSPVCPMCWPGYKKKQLGEFPTKLPAPVLRALLRGNITSFKELSKHTESEILALHGVGPTSIPKLRAALKTAGFSFRTSDRRRRK